MSIENSDSNRQYPPLSAVERDIFNQTKIDILQDNERTSYSLAGVLPGTTFLMETDEGQVEFAVYPTGLAEAILPGEAVYAQVRNPGDGAIPFSEMMIFGASEELTMITSKLGTIEQYADFAYAPLRRKPLWEEDYEISQKDYEEKIRLGEIVRTNMGSLRMIQDEPRVAASVLELAVKDPDGIYEDVFVYQD